MKKMLGSVVALALAVGCGLTTPAHAVMPLDAPPGAPTLAPRAGTPTDAEALPDAGDEMQRVMVLLKAQPDGVGDPGTALPLVEAVAQRYEGQNGVSIRRQFGTLVNGFSATLPAREVARLQADPDIASVTPMAVFYQSMQTAGELTQSVQARTSHQVDGRGLVVSIIDSGIDIAHQDMRLDPGVPEKLQPETGWTHKVPYGWNFADQNATVKDTGSQHGMHVAGIVAANAEGETNAANGRIDGIAPNAQLLAMKVFSNDPAAGSGAYEDDIIAAIEASVEKKADIINMSLGSPNGLNGAVGEGRAVLNAQKAGVQVLVAAGNEGLQWSTGGNLIDPTNKLDNGTVGNPSTTQGAWSVASVNNSSLMVTKATATWATGSREFGYQLAVGTPDGQKHLLVDCGIGQPTEIPDTVKGNYALIQRGTLNFTDKFKNAMAKGAAGVVIWNNQGDAYVGMSGVDALTGVFGASIFQSDGQALKDQLAKGTVEVAFSKDRALVPNPVSLAPSDFTSWGTTAELAFKPEIAGIGGSVWSTANDNGYQNMSGTSMATPHMAGVFALGLQAYQKSMPSVSTNERNTLLRLALSNTAKILEKDGVPYAPRQIGAGLAQTDTALDTTVFATVDGAPHVALRQVNGDKTFTVTLDNKGTKARTFTTGSTCVLNEERTPTTAQHTVCNAAESLVAGATTVTVQPGATAAVTFTVKPALGTNHWIEGWARLASADADQPSLSIPYMGFVGDWNAEPIVDTPYSLDTKAPQSFLSGLLGASQNNRTMLYSDNNGSSYGRAPSAYSKAWISPNGDGVYDNVFPAIMLLRSASDARYSVRTTDGKEIAVTGTETDLQRVIRAKLTTTSGRAHVARSAAWNGKVYDSATDTFTTVADGDYVFRAETRLSADFPWQVTDMPFSTDTTKPQVTVSKKAGVAGSVTYTVTVTDTGSGAARPTVTLMPEGRTISVGYSSPSTFTVSGAAANSYVQVDVSDYAGNKADTVYDFVTTGGVQVADRAVLGKAINTKSTWSNGSPIIKDGKVNLTLLVNGTVASATANGTPLTLAADAGMRKVTVPVTVKEGPNPVVLTWQDATGAEATETMTIVVDTIAPKVVDLTFETDANGAIVLEQGFAVVSGRVVEERAKPNAPKSDDRVCLLDPNFLEIPLNDDGTFNGVVQAKAGATEVMLFAMDSCDPLKLTYLNLGGVRIPISGATAVTSSDVRIFFDDSRFDGAQTAPFGKAYAILDKTYPIALQGDQVVLNLKGRFSSAVGSFEVAGKPVAVGADNRFAVTIPLTEGITHVGYVVKDTDGKQLAAGSWRYFYDKTAPAVSLTTDPAIAADGAIWTQKATPVDVSLKGEIYDNAFGYSFKVNGSLVSQFEAMFDPGMAANKQVFSKTLAGQRPDVDKIRLSVYDMLGNGYEQTIPVRSDLVDPTLAITAVANGAPVVFSDTELAKLPAGTPITSTAKDAHLRDLVVSIDGKVVDTQTATITRDPAAKVETVDVGTPTAKAAAADPAESLVTLTSTVKAPAADGKPHTLTAVATDLSGRTVSQTVLFAIADMPPTLVCDTETIVIDANAEASRLEQLQKHCTVTDDVDKDLLVTAELDNLILDQETTVTVSVKDSAGNVTSAQVKVLLQRPLTTLAGECGSMTARFAKGDTITITCTKQADGTIAVLVRNAAEQDKVTGELTLNVDGSPVVLLDEQGNPLSKLDVKPEGGKLVFQSASKAAYVIGVPAGDKGTTPADPTTPGEGTKPGDGTTQPGDDGKKPGDHKPGDRQDPPKLAKTGGR